jgi:5-oxoprolinase (ATP-hydrolysing)
MEGGNPGASGRNTWVKQVREEDGDKVEGADGTREINIGGKATIWMGKGDRLVIETPGGGGWGVDESAQHGQRGPHKHTPAWEPRGSIAERAAAQAGF